MFRCSPSLALTRLYFHIYILTIIIEAGSRLCEGDRRFASGRRLPWAVSVALVFAANQRDNPFAFSRKFFS